MAFQTEFNLALRAVLGAGKILKKGAKTARDYRLKGAIDLVTEWDLKSQTHVTEIIRRRFPDHDFLSEEAAAGPRTSPSCWILDPIDGTTNFVHGFPFYAVSLALLREEELVIGIVHNPELEETYWAVRGEGAFLIGERLRV
ncbi:MAG: inositol monophosphatase, partial [Desulfobacterota bacterium]|nr:inositol monophosphatase [Thermodesulfobacteriota bacterium]